MGVAFLPTGRVVNNPDSVKLVQVIRSEAYGKTNYVVSVKLDDDSELMVDSLTDETEAFALAEICIERINAAADDEFLYGDDDDAAADDGIDDDDDFDDTAADDEGFDVDEGAADDAADDSWDDDSW